MKLLTLAGYFGVLYLLFTSLMGGDISIGAFAAVFASIGTMFNVMEEIVSQHFGNMTKNIGTVRNFIRFLDLPEREGKDLPVNPGNGIALDHVSFRYPGVESNALSEVSLEVKKGETIAIVGANGAGKSTLMQLMMRLYLPTAGSVRIDGIDTTEASPQSVYRRISAVFQNYQRYKMTLANNIDISDPADEDQATVNRNIAIASEKAGSHLDQNRFPQGYETMLSREFGGVDLSGGQWQRIAIARGFYRDHELLILDEPTAAIDPIEETRVYEKFREISSGKTAIIVTHRLGSTKIADRIIVMAHGQIVETGTHEELMRQGGHYAEMYATQAKWYVRTAQ